ncbi:MAG: preprotein translocase subunit YajC [Candidatus Eisenbacteria bacterium]
MWTDALAQAGAPAGASNPTVAMLLQLLQFVPIFLILYFLLIRPQQQRQKKLELMLKDLKKGDRVVTTGGIIGTVVGIDDARAVLKIAEDVKVEFTKAAITQVLAVEAKS